MGAAANVRVNGSWQTGRGHERNRFRSFDAAVTSENLLTIVHSTFRDSNLFFSWPSLGLVVTRYCWHSLLISSVKLYYVWNGNEERVVFFIRFYVLPIAEFVIVVIRLWLFVQSKTRYRVVRIGRNNRITSLMRISMRYCYHKGF